MVNNVWLWQKKNKNFKTNFVLNGIYFQYIPLWFPRYFILM